MHQVRYSDGSSVNEVIQFLRDKKVASETPGLTAVSVREKRLEQRRKLEEAYATEYPFFGVLTCGRPGHINISLCFAGGRNGVDSELELRNGDKKRVFKVFNLREAGDERRDGFYIDLRRSFELLAQNVS
jgi:hypothetical protein